MAMGHLLPALLLPLGIVLGWSLRDVREALEPPSAAREVRLRGHTFTRPLLECDLAGDGGHLETFHKRVIDAVEEIKRIRGARHVSVYFRDLDRGESFGIGEQERFAPASLLKVPLLITVLERAQTNPALLEQEIRVPGGDSQGLYQHIVPEDPLVAGQVYTVEQILEKMIIESDNRAANVIFALAGRDALERVYRGLGVRFPSDDYTADFMTVAEYAAFFRVLYNASYLMPDASESALRLLAQSKFHDGLVAGVPEGVIVAHKFGERVIEGAGVMRHQLHDCGIVYHPERPYLLCVMSRGEYIKSLAATIRDVSHTVYEEMSRYAGDHT